MGQKVNPHGLRVGVIKDWDSKWYADGDFADYLVEDYNIRTFLKKKLYAAGVSKIEIERASDRVKVIIYTAKPGVVIGKGGAEIEKIKAEVQKLTDKKLVVDIKEVKRPDRDAQLVAENIALQLFCQCFNQPSTILRTSFSMLFFFHYSPPNVPISKYRNLIGCRVCLLTALLDNTPNVRNQFISCHMLQLILFHNLKL